MQGGRRDSQHTPAAYSSYNSFRITTTRRDGHVRTVCVAD